MMFCSDSSGSERFDAIMVADTDTDADTDVCGGFLGLLVVGLRPCKADIARPLPPTESGGSN